MEPNRTWQVSGTAVASTSSLTAKVATRHYLASQHLWTAMVSADRCVAMEQDLLQNDGPATHPTVRGHAIAAVLSSVAFLESWVNEIYQDAAEGSPGRVDALSAPCRILMSEYWADGEKSSILSKYQMALLFAGLEKLDTATAPYQDAAVLVALRNALVHFRPSWHRDESPANLEKRLSGKFVRSPLLPCDDGSPWPIWALAGPGARWSVSVSRALADEWSDRLELTRTYEDEVAAFAGQVK